MRISLVAAVARGGVIGRGNTVPWHLPDDMERFKALTMGRSVVMGRKTWDSLPDRFRPLPGRRNIVITRNAVWDEPGAERAASLEEALRLTAGEDHVFVIGGGEVYAAALPIATDLLLTEIDAAVDGDVVFPSFDADEFVETAREERRSADGTPYAFVTYERSA